MLKTILLAAATSMVSAAFAQEGIQPTTVTTDYQKTYSDVLTPEKMWAMHRLGGTQASPDGKLIAYQLTTYSVKDNKGTTLIYVMDSNGKNTKQLTADGSESDPAFVGNDRIAFMRDGQLWIMNADGSNRKQLTHSKTDIEGFKFSPDGSKVVLIKSIPYYGSIKKNPDDLPLATGMVITDMNYRHWDHYVKTIAHPFVATVDGDNIGDGKDILEGQPYECPMAPFGGIEQISWSPDSKSIAYTCRQEEGVAYANSTDADIFVYDIATGKAVNMCKLGLDMAPYEQARKEMDFTRSLGEQKINHLDGDYNVGYDINPAFSPDGKYLAWQSMERCGYESDRNRLCVLDLQTGKKKYVTEDFDSNIDGFAWGADSRTIYFMGVWHATEMLYQTDLNGQINQLTDGWFDYGSLALLGDGKRLITTRHSMSHPDDIFIVTPSKKAKKSKVEQITAVNSDMYDRLELGKIQERWVKTTDGKDMQVWIILPPHFDETKKYPTLLYCEGGPQSPVSQFWSYRWNFQQMAAHGYVIVAPNRRGLPGYGQAWNEEVSGDWTGQCMKDYLSAIDDATENLPFVDKDHLGCVGASFGGFSVYYLAGHHDKRFKCFIAHDGAFNLPSMYTDTEEAWFSNWEYKDAYWNKNATQQAKQTYENSPHLSVGDWDTPILCIHGEKDYRINANQGMGAFNAARMRGIPAELLLYPDENHWVLKPQNAILWQRTFFGWLDRWLK